MSVVSGGRGSSAGNSSASDVDPEVSEIEAKTVINAAGLDASSVARAFAGSDRSGGAAIADGSVGGAITDSGHTAVPETRYAKGSYFLYDGPSPFNHLVYPLPVDGGLGIHATHDMAGSLRFGPDVEWIDSIDYAVDGARATQFAQAVATWWPDLDPTRLTPRLRGRAAEARRSGRTAG